MTDARELHGSASGLEKEKAFQAERARRVAGVVPTPDAIVERYRRHRNWRLVPKDCLFRFLGPLEDREILDFGCGEGMLTTQFALLGARVTGVDVSPDLIDLARRRAELDRVSDRVRLLEGDVLELGALRERSFDAIVCSAVLHHVEIEPVFERLLELAKPGARVVVQEPVVFSSALRRIRDVVPVAKDVSPGERQLTRSDVDYLASRLRDPRIRYFRLTARLVRLLPNRAKLDASHPFSTATALGLMALDQVALTLVRPLRRYAGTVVLGGTAM